MPREASIRGRFSKDAVLRLTALFEAPKPPWNLSSLLSIVLVALFQVPRETTVGYLVEQTALKSLGRPGACKVGSGVPGMPQSVNFPEHNGSEETESFIDKRLSHTDQDMFYFLRI